MGAKTWLLGMMHGHFDVRDFNSDVGHGDVVGAINSGIGVVIPVKKIMETLAHPHLSKLRKEAADRTPPEEPSRRHSFPCGSRKTYGTCHGIGRLRRLRVGQMKMTIEDIQEHLDADLELARRIEEAKRKNRDQIQRDCRSVGRCRSVLACRGAHRAQCVAVIAPYDPRAGFRPRSAAAETTGADRASRCPAARRRGRGTTATARCRSVLACRGERPCRR